MNYLLKSKPRTEHKGKVILVVSVFLLVLFIEIVFPNVSKDVLYAVARPLWVVEGTITSPFHSVVGFFKSKNSIIKKNLELEDELASLRLKEIDYDILLKESQELKNEIGRHVSKNFVFARVLSRPPRSPYDTLVIDVGSSQGIAPAERVYLSDNVIIGVITSVSTNTSLVQLFSSSGYKQEAILSRTGASFTLNGKGGANFQIEVPKDADVLWGDMFLYPGISSSVIGSVYYIDINSQSSFKTVYIRTPGNVFQSKSVFIEGLPR